MNNNKIITAKEAEKESFKCLLTLIEKLIKEQINQGKFGLRIYVNCYYVSRIIFIFKELGYEANLVEGKHTIEILWENRNQPGLLSISD